jgi:hypothetical protein
VDWAVGNSKYIFETLPAEEIDVQLTRSGLIEPTKSISSVIGMGPNVQQAPNLFSCAGCPRLQDCPYAVEGDATAAES